MTIQCLGHSLIKAQSLINIINGVSQSIVE